MGRRPAWLLPLCLLLIASSASAELVLSSAPRGSRESEEQIYQPIARLLSQALGQPVSFRWGDNFLIYQSEMRKGTYDILLDGPHLVSWRMTRLNHTPIVRFPGSLEFVVIVRKDQTRVKSVKDLVGRSVCAIAPPNLSTVVVLSEFDNPSRQPLILGVQGFADAYQGVVSGRCAAGILQAKLYLNLDKEAKAAKVIFDTQPLPEQAFTVGPRVTPEMRTKITEALLSPDGAVATQKLRDTFKATNLLAANPDDYRGLDRLLRSEYGFD